MIRIGEEVESQRDLKDVSDIRSVCDAESISGPSLNASFAEGAVQHQKPEVAL